MLDARTAPARATSPMRRNTVFLTSISSNTASTIRSASESASMSEAGVRSAAARASGVILPRATAPSRFRATVPAPRSSASGVASTIVTGIPARRQAVAMPEPMVPPPMTPTRSSRRGSTPLSSGSLATARSAKKAWIMPSRWGESMSSAKSSRSRRKPSA